MTEAEERDWLRLLSTKPLRLWVVTREPRPFDAERYVARLWEIGATYSKPTKALLVAPELESIRACLPAGLYRLDRMPEDDPAVVEVWL
jgi:hypothetical protein